MLQSLAHMSGVTSSGRTDPADQTMMPYRQPGAGIRLFAFSVKAELCVTLPSNGSVRSYSGR